MKVTLYSLQRPHKITVEVILQFWSEMLYMNQLGDFKRQRNLNKWEINGSHADKVKMEKLLVG